MNILDMELIHPKKKVNRQIYSTPGFYVYRYSIHMEWKSWQAWQWKSQKIPVGPFIKNKDNHNLQLVQE